MIVIALASIIIGEVAFGEVIFERHLVAVIVKTNYLPSGPTSRFATWLLNKRFEFDFSHCPRCRHDVTTITSGFTRGTRHQKESHHAVNQYFHLQDIVVTVDGVKILVILTLIFMTVISLPYLN